MGPKTAKTAQVCLVFASLGAAVYSGPPAGPGPREGHSLVYDGARRMTLLLDGYPSSSAPLRGEVWGRAAGPWRRLAGRGPGARTLSAAAYDSRRRVTVVFGGLGVVNQNRYGDTWEWDGRRWIENGTARAGRGPRRPVPAAASITRWPTT